MLLLQLNEGRLRLMSKVFFLLSSICVFKLVTLLSPFMKEFSIRVDRKPPFDASRLVATFADRGRRGNQTVILQGGMSMVVILVRSRLLEKFYAEYGADFPQKLTILGLGKFYVKQVG